MTISACGINCEECPYFISGTCQGCVRLKGEPFWTKEMTPKGVCPLYDCAVNDKGFKNCGGCADLPCQLFLEMKDPDMSDEDHQKSIQTRVLRLRAN